MKKEQRRRYVVDHIKIWTPLGTSGINHEIIDNYVIALSKRFRFAMVTYDAHESRQSMARLRRNGVPTKLTEFRKRYKEEIYRHLEQLLISGDLALPGNGPHSKLLELELKNLKRRWSPQGGFSIGPNEEGEVKTDDLADSLAGACGTAFNQAFSGLPKPEAVYMPLVREAHNWNIGYGSYTQGQFNQLSQRFGIGTG